MSSKMVDTFSKMVNHFCQKAIFLYISYHTILFKFHQDIVQIRYEETLDFQCQDQPARIKCPIGKPLSAVNTPLKLFSATRCSCWHRESKLSPKILFDIFDHMLVKFEPNRMVRNGHNFELFDKIPSFFKIIFDNTFGKNWLGTFWSKFSKLRS